MAFTDILKQLGLGLAQGGAQGLQNLGLSMQQRSNPQLFAQQQENQRQQAQLAQQLQLHNTITPYEQQMLGIRQQEYGNQLQWHEDQVKRERDAADQHNQEYLAQQLGEGNLQYSTAGEDGAFNIGGRFVKPVPKQKMQVPQHYQDLFGLPPQLEMNKENAPYIGDIFRTQQAEDAAANKKKSISPALYQQYQDQLNKLFPDSTAGEDGPLQVSVPSGSIAARHNNPFNLKYAGQPNAVQGEAAKDGGNWAKFDTPENGWQAGVSQYGMGVGRGQTLSSYITQFAPPFDKNGKRINDTEGYIKQAEKSLGLPEGAAKNTPLDQVDTNKFLDFQANLESGSKRSGASVLNPDNARYRDLYSSQIKNMLDAGDLTRADTLMNQLTDAKRKEDVAVSQKRAETKAQDDQGMEDVRKLLPDSKLDNAWEQVQNGRILPQDLEKFLGISDKYGRRRMAEYMTQNNKQFPVALDNQSRTALSKMEPVLDSLYLMRNDLEPYKNDKQIARFLVPRAQYAFGYTGREKDGTDWGPTISRGEMDRIRGVAQSLAGLRTALPIFEQGQIHTPNFWKDSGKTAYDKLQNMISYLENNKAKIYKYGQKSGVVIPDSMLQSAMNPQPSLVDRILGRNPQQPQGGQGDLSGLSTQELLQRVAGGPR